MFAIATDASVVVSVELLKIKHTERWWSMRGSQRSYKEKEYLSDAESGTGSKRADHK